MLNKRGLCQWEIDLEFLRVDSKQSESAITRHKTDRVPRYGDVLKLGVRMSNVSVLCQFCA